MRQARPYSVESPLKDYYYIIHKQAAESGQFHHHQQQQYPQKLFKREDSPVTINRQTQQNYPVQGTKFTPTQSFCIQSSNAAAGRILTCEKDQEEPVYDNSQQRSFVQHHQAHRIAPPLHNHHQHSPSALQEPIPKLKLFYNLEQSTRECQVATNRISSESSHCHSNSNHSQHGSSSPTPLSSSFCSSMSSLPLEQQHQQISLPFLSLQDLLYLPRKAKKARSIRIDLTQTRYDVIHEVCEETLGWAVQTEQHQQQFNCNIQWMDSYIQEEDFRRMQTYMKVNHFPQSQQLGKKNLLAANLQAMKANNFQLQYDFFPQTWMFPSQIEELQANQANSGDKEYYIVKPEAQSQGRGIFLTQNIEQLLGQQNYVVQQYIANPLLIDGLKFDLRLYVLLKNLDPLKIFLYQEGLARFATVPYHPPNLENSHNLLMHLTNYALNKKSKLFRQNDGIHRDHLGHKRSFSAVLKRLFDEGRDVDTLLQDINGIIVKTIVSALPHMIASYKKLQPKSKLNDMCFELFGFDVMIDDKMKPWLIEVNHTPSFWTDSPLDYEVKRVLITDTLNLINVEPSKKSRFFETRVLQQIASRSHHQRRLGTNQSSEIVDKQAFEASEQFYEEQNMCGYKRIFPMPLTKRNDYLHIQHLISSSSYFFQKSAYQSKEDISQLQNYAFHHTPISQRNTVQQHLHQSLLIQPIQRNANQEAEQLVFSHRAEKLNNHRFISPSPQPRYNLEQLNQSHILRYNAEPTKPVILVRHSKIDNLHVNLPREVKQRQNHYEEDPQQKAVLEDGSGQRANLFMVSTNKQPMNQIRQRNEADANREGFKESIGESRYQQNKPASADRVYQQKVPVKKKASRLRVEDVGLRSSADGFPRLDGRSIAGKCIKETVNISMNFDLNVRIGGQGQVLETKESFPKQKDFNGGNFREGSNHLQPTERQMKLRSISYHQQANTVSNKSQLCENQSELPKSGISSTKINIQERQGGLSRVKKNNYENLPEQEHHRMHHVMPFIIQPRETGSKEVFHGSLIRQQKS